MYISNCDFAVDSLINKPGIFCVYVKNRHDFDIVGSFSSREKARHAIEIMRTYGGYTSTYGGTYTDIDTGAKYTAFQLLETVRNDDHYSGMAPAAILHSFLWQSGGNCSWTDETITE